jgi:alpha-tubulin suppressor-like RCC1 family protein
VSKPKLSHRYGGKTVALGIVCLWAGISCSTTPAITAPIAARLVIATSPSSTAAAGVALSPQPVIQISDATGSPVASRGVLITATIASGGGALSGTTALRTDNDGRAVFLDLAITGAVGPRTLRFSASGLASATSPDIALEHGPPNSIVIATGSNQTVPAGTQVPVLPTVRVLDGSGNPVPGVEVAFSVTDGGGMIVGPSQITDAAGQAAVGGWTLGTGIGLNVLSATVTGLTNGMVAFHATGVIGPPASITILEGDLQSATIGSAVDTPPAVKVTDAFDNPIAGVAVAFVVTAGGGTLTTSSPVTDATGTARIGAWRLGLTPGVNGLSVSVGTAPAEAFSATAVDLTVLAISAGGTHSCAALASDGRCWGTNINGQLGNGTVSPDSMPVVVTGALVPTQVGAGQSHSCLLAVAGTAHCWGLNSSGQVGDGTTTSSLVPVTVTGGHVFTMLTVGAFHTCGLKADGSVYCWGAGANGRLGNGFTQNAGIPQLVTGGFNFITVSAGTTHTCAVRMDGIVLCWGSNVNGRLGDGTTTDRLTPTSVSGAGIYTTVAAGGAHSCAIDTTGVAWCWGLGTSGQLGTGSLPAQLLMPTTVAGSTSFSAITTGSLHSCGLDGAGSAWCWGSNGLGRLGDGTTVLRSSPVGVLGGLSYTAISAGGQHTCARSSAGSALCWGRSAEGQVGDGQAITRLTPVGVKAP